MTKQRKTKKDSQKLIAYCGLYCGDCLGYKQTVADLARDLRKALRQAHFGELAEVIAQVPAFKTFVNYPQCYEVLGALMKLRCTKTCRGNGGPPSCEIRTCARKRKLDGCWQCDTLETCTTLDMLRPHHGDAHVRNLRKIQRDGAAAFIEGKRHWCTARKG